VIWRAAFVAILLLSSTADAGELNLTGKRIQGGLVVGWATPGSKITLDGKSIQQARAGEFLLGFSRDAKAISSLKILFKDGSTEMRELKIEQRKYNIQRIDGLPKRKVTPNAKDFSRIKSERMLINKARLTAVDEPHFTAGFTRPVEGRISGVYGSQRILNGKPRRPHFGVDIAAPIGTKIKAASAGIVVFAHPGMFFNGKTLVINHGMGLRSTYIHMSAISVNAGDRVIEGQIVGKVGKTGRATGPHLHWGLTLGRTPLDPELLLK
jgi:murein DD-endopeptidase MepM/ murein hydrolase activator NlpD